MNKTLYFQDFINEFNGGTMNYQEYLKHYHSTYKYAQILSDGVTFYTLGRVFRTLQGARMYITKNTI